jgi:choice-of-anchor B domain-containing protein
MLTAAHTLHAQPQQATSLGNWQDDNIAIVPWLNGRYNEVWGFAMNDREYAVLGSTSGMHFIDVTNPAEPQQVALIPGTSAGPNIIHRDFKDFNGYLYCVADEGNAATLQIIDLQNLPDTAVQVYASNEFVITAHNLFIDTSQSRLYLLGAQNKTILLDISNPEAPALLGTYPNTSYYLPYVHDAYIRNHIGIMNCGFDGLWVVDFANPANPVTLGTMTSYAGAGYNHSGWLSDDGKYYYLCDETHGSPVKVVDMSDYSNLKIVATMDPASAPTQIPHNALLRDDKLYLSYYYDGLQVFDISNPQSPQRIAMYDTYGGPDDDFYAGAWGVYPNLPSGHILISDIQSGLWVFAPLSGTSSATGQPLSSAPDVYPNPARDEVFVSLPAGSDAATPFRTSLYNAAGQVCLEDLANVGEQLLRLPVKGLAPGIYFLKITGKSSYSIHKIVIE